MVTVIADIGGTHARFARYEDGEVTDTQKRPVSDFSSFEEALIDYSPESGQIYIATAAWPYQDGTWRFARPDRWVISEQAIKEAGWELGYIGNDFGASSIGAVSLSADKLHNVKPAQPNEIMQDRYTVLGAGTGLGLAYVRNGQAHETYGGHMEAPHRTDEQHTVIKLISRCKEDGRPVSAEDILSGSGLVLLYKAVSLLHGKETADIAPAAILADTQNSLNAQTLRLFHELLGLFAHQAVIFGHGYAGLYMDGGVIHNLVEAQAFDNEAFLSYFIGDPLPLIKSQIEAMAVNIVMDPFVALTGLTEIIKGGDYKE